MLKHCKNIFFKLEMQTDKQHCESAHFTNTIPGNETLSLSTLPTAILPAMSFTGIKFLDTGCSLFINNEVGWKDFKSIQNILQVETSQALCIVSKQSWEDVVAILSLLVAAKTRSCYSVYWGNHIIWVWAGPCLSTHFTEVQINIKGHFAGLSAWSFIM